MCRFIVNTKEILSSFTRAKAKLSKGVKICAVVKANAYGFGMSKIVTLLSTKADYFAVARLSEFLTLKDLTKKPCLILSPLSPKECKVALLNGAEITISQCSDIDYINRVAGESGRPARVHLKVDTGMNRFGFKTQKDVSELLEKLKGMKNIKLVGCYSHLLKADDDKLAGLQRERFLKFRELVLSYGFKPIFHFANSAGLKDVNNQFDMVRLGFDLYFSPKHLHKLVCNIIEIKDVERGEPISYGAHFVAKEKMRIAICSAGYADGVSRKLSSRGKVLIDGKEAMIVGDVCMDCFMVDVTKIDACVGGEVVIFGKSGEKYISVCDVARLCDTIPYEIYTGISPRVKRLYRWKDASYSGKV